MQRSKIEIYLHFVWTTKRRAHWLTPAIEKQLYRCIGHDVTKLKCQILAIGGMPDHVHLVTSMSSMVGAAQLAKAVKGNSSLLANERLGFEGAFDWQDNYAVFSVGSELESVLSYVRRQKEHHAANDLWEEWEKSYDEV